MVILEGEILTDIIFVSKCISTTNTHVIKRGTFVFFQFARQMLYHTHRYIKKVITFLSSKF